MARRRGGRGGYRAPDDKAPRVSGAGAASQRIDNQPVQVPDFGTSEDLTFGDRQRLEEAMRQQPIAQQASPRVAPAPTGGSLSPPGGRGALPEFLFGMPSGRPTEPSSEGLAMGPGAGPEVLAPEPADAAEEVLTKLAEAFGDEFATEMLAEIRNQRPAPAPMPTPTDEGAPTGEEVEEADEPGIVDFPIDVDDRTEGEEPGEVVEETEPAAEEEAPEAAPSGEEAVAEASVEGAEGV